MYTSPAGLTNMKIVCRYKKFFKFFPKGYFKVIFRVEGKNAAVLSWPRNSKPKLSPSRQIQLHRQDFLNIWTHYRSNEQTFDCLKRIYQPHESIAVFRDNVGLCKNIHGEADFFWKQVKGKIVLVFPERNLSTIRFNSTA